MERIDGIVARLTLQLSTCDERLAVDGLSWDERVAVQLQRFAVMDELERYGVEVYA